MWIGMLLAAMALSVAVLTRTPPSRQPSVNGVELAPTASMERASAGVTPGEKAAAVALRHHKAAVELVSTRLFAMWWPGQYQELTIEDVAPYIAPGGDPAPETWGIKSGVWCISNFNYGCWDIGSVWVIHTWVEKGPGAYDRLPGGEELVVQTRTALAAGVRGLRHEIRQFPGAAGVLLGHIDDLPTEPGSGEVSKVSRWTSADGALAIPDVQAMGGGPWTADWWVQGSALVTPIVKPPPNWGSQQ